MLDDPNHFTSTTVTRLDVTIPRNEAPRVISSKFAIVFCSVNLFVSLDDTAANTPGILLSALYGVNCATRRLDELAYALERGHAKISD
jgi:hypothetical protein